MNKEVVELLWNNRVLLHNLLVWDADKHDKMASECNDVDDKRALIGYAKYRRELAAQIEKG